MTSFECRKIRIYNDTDLLLFYDISTQKEGSSIPPYDSTTLTFSQITLLTFIFIFYRNHGRSVRYRRSCGLTKDTYDDIHVKFENDDIIISK